ncbi:hypothetical protein R6L23_35975 [Streptomyces sp. SR27]|nr:hypothetical protein [Streptomyces sp. SR27]MDV9193549.1 hypothetical protein [Streptomyces sp. SR27]
MDDQRDLDEMYAAYEEMDAAEYAEFNAGMDAQDAARAQRAAERDAT